MSSAEIGRAAAHKEGITERYLALHTEPAKDIDFSKLRDYKEILASDIALTGEHLAEITATVISAASNERAIKFKQGDATYAIFPAEDDQPEIRLFHNPEGKVPGGDATVVVETKSSSGKVEEKIIYGRDPEGGMFEEDPVLFRTITADTQQLPSFTGNVENPGSGPVTSREPLHTEGNTILTEAISRC